MILSSVKGAGLFAIENHSKVGCDIILRAELYTVTKILVKV